ncbi:MAG TPA: FAD-dependent oxidoreductase, partial [Solirubrobacteraceae bacterium]|nr:FAD-dependent oxidoreductase [Solirubrobacteraceae bacterium]
MAIIKILRINSPERSSRHEPAQTDLGRHRSLWLDTASFERHRPLPGDRNYDVVVVGAGITGLTTALMLARAGLAVGVLEAARIGAGTSGHTTAKVTSQHGLAYSRLRRTLGLDAAVTYGAANEVAKERVAAFAAEGIECDFRRRPAYVYASAWWQEPLVRLEARDAAAAGLPARFVDRVPLPFPTAGAVRFDDQAELHAGRYLSGLARLLGEAGGEIFEGTRARAVHEGRLCRVETDHGVVRAEHAVLATLLPFADRGGFFARAFPSRSYLLSARIADPPPEGCFISAAPPVRTIRSHPVEDGELLLVGGEGHHAGDGRADPERYRRLAAFARRHWHVESIEHHWSAQDYSTGDGVPFVGRLHPATRRLHVATGMGKWGMTNGTVAAILLTDAILGRRNAWAPVFSATRIR